MDVPTLMEDSKLNRSSGLKVKELENLCVQKYTHQLPHTLLFVGITDGSWSIPRCFMVINYFASGFMPSIGVKGSFTEAR